MLCRKKEEGLKSALSARLLVGRFTGRRCLQTKQPPGCREYGRECFPAGGPSGLFQGHDDPAQVDFNDPADFHRAVLTFAAQRHAATVSDRHNYSFLLQRFHSPAGRGKRSPLD